MCRTIIISSLAGLLLVAFSGFAAPRPAQQSGCEDECEERICYVEKTGLFNDPVFYDHDYACALSLFTDSSTGKEFEEMPTHANTRYFADGDQDCLDDASDFVQHAKASGCETINQTGWTVQCGNCVDPDG